MKFLANALFKGTVTADGNVILNAVSKGTTDTDKFLILDGSTLKYRTGAELLSDIAAQPLLTINNNADYRVLTGSGTANTLNASTKLEWYNDYGILVLKSTASWGYGAEIDFDNQEVNGTQWGFYGGSTTDTGFMLYRYLPSQYELAYWNIDRYAVRNDVKIGWSSTNVSFGAIDTAFARESAGLVQINNGTTNTYASLKLLNLTATSLAGTGNRMVIANSSGTLSTQAIPSATGLQTAVDTDKSVSSSLAVGTSTVKSVSASTYSGVFFDYVVKNGTNVRVGSVVAITNGTDIEYYETLSNDIGTTTGITFAADLSGGNIRLRATTTATGWTVIVSTRAL